MAEHRAQGGRRTARKPRGDDPRFKVYGLNILIKMLPDSEDPRGIQCPKGQPIRYGAVVACGDGYDSQANAFRDMPKLGAVVAFEEMLESVEGHFFYVNEQEYRILHLDVLIIAFPPES